MSGDKASNNYWFLIKRPYQIRAHLDEFYDSFLMNNNKMWNKTAFFGSQSDYYIFIY